MSLPVSDVGLRVMDNMRPILDLARAEDKAIVSNYENIWFTPDKLEEQWKQGNFLWGPVNWRLEDKPVFTCDGCGAKEKRDSPYAPTKWTHGYCEECWTKMQSAIAPVPTEEKQP